MSRDITWRTGRYRPPLPMSRDITWRTGRYRPRTWEAISPSASPLESTNLTL